MLVENWSGHPPANVVRFLDTGGRPRSHEFIRSLRSLRSLGHWLEPQVKENEQIRTTCGRAQKTNKFVTT